LGALSFKLLTPGFVLLDSVRRSLPLYGAAKAYGKQHRITPKVMKPELA
jgi:hypothetical protein